MLYVPPSVGGGLVVGGGVEATGVDNVNTRVELCVGLGVVSTSAMVHTYTVKIGYSDYRIL